MRLIDADALDMYERLKSYYGDAWRDAQEEIDNAPTVDAVPVIRCKDCKYYRIYKNTDWTVELCGRFRTTMADPVKEDDYCSKAERRTDEIN